MKYLSYTILFSLIFLCSCSKNSYNPKDFSQFATGDIHDSRLGALIINFLKDLSENKIPKQKQDEVFKVVTNIFIEKQMGLLKDNTPYINILRFSDNNPLMLGPQIQHGIQQTSTESDAFPLFNRYRCQLKANIYLNNKQIENLDSLGGLFSGFTNTIQIPANKLSEEKNVLTIKGTIVVFDSEKNSKQIYSRQIDPHFS